MTKHLTYASIEALSHGLDAAIYRISRLEESTGTAPAGAASATAARIAQSNAPNGHEFTSAEIAGMAGKALADPKTAKGMRKMLGSLLTQTKDKPRKPKAKKAKRR